jgi:hypothetical protein
MLNLTDPGVVAEAGREVHERRLRALARPSRAVRAALASSLMVLVQRAIDQPSQLLVRAVVPDGLADSGYVFLRFPYFEERWSSYDDYRKERQSALMAYVAVFKMQNPHLTHVVGLSSELVGPSSFEIQYISVDEWDDAAADAARQLQSELNIFTNPRPFHGNLVEEAVDIASGPLSEAQRTESAPIGERAVAPPRRSRKPPAPKRRRKKRKR